MLSIMHTIIKNFIKNLTQNKEFSIIFQNKHTGIELCQHFIYSQEYLAVHYWRVLSSFEGSSFSYKTRGRKKFPKVSFFF